VLAETAMYGCIKLQGTKRFKETIKAQWFQNGLGSCAVKALGSSAEGWWFDPHPWHDLFLD